MKSAKIELKIDNKNVPSPVVESLVLNQVLGDHHRFIIELRRRPELEDVFGRSMEANAASWLSKTIDLKVISADRSAGDPGELRFVGVVSDVSFTSKVDSLGNIVIKGYSPTIMLDLNRMYRIWCDIASGDIISGIISDEELPNANVSASGGTTHPGFLAYGDTAYELISYLAVFEGWWAYYDGLNYHVVKDLPDDRIDLKANHLDSFSVEVDATKLKDFSSSAYEYVEGKWFQSDSRDPSLSALPLGKTAGEAAKISSTRGRILIFHNPTSQQDLDSRVEIESKRSYSSLVRSAGTTDRLGLFPGKSIQLSWEPGKRVTESRREESFNGLYLVVSVQHSYKDGKYSCDFRCVARDLAHPCYRMRSLPESFVEPAWVTAVSDPEANKLGRVRVRFGWDSERSNLESPFIRVSQIHAGSNGGASHGSWVLPEFDDCVLVLIRGRHLENAVIIGSVYDGKHLPEAEMYSDENMIKSFYTKSGNQIKVSDSEGGEQIAISSKNGTCSLVLDSTDGQEKFSIAVKDNAASLVMDGSSGNEKISLSCGDSSCEISLDAAQKSVKIESENSIVLKANEITLEAQSVLNIKSQAQMIQKAGTNIDMDGGAMVKVKGGVIQLN